MLFIFVSIALAVMIPLGVILWLLGWPWFLGIVAGLVAGAVIVLPRLANPGAVVLRGIPMTAPDPVRHARLLNLVDGLSLTTGVVDPTLGVIDDRARNAITVADDSGVTMAVTQGLLDALDRLQLEGVIAELLIRAKDGDAEIATRAAALVIQFTTGPFAPFGSFVTSRVASVFDEDRDLLADQAAVGVTRYPPGLAAAFAELRSGSLEPSCASRPNAHLWLVPLPNALAATHPLELRIDVLEEI